jgi:hypothetical protein
MTSTPTRFVIEDCDDHYRSRVVVCTINVHIVVRVGQTQSVSSNVGSGRILSKFLPGREVTNCRCTDSQG